MIQLNNYILSFFLSFLLLGCSTTEKTEIDEDDINQLLDNWHLAAAQADEDVFFSSMTEDCIYLGTDKSEKWKRDELKSWSEKYFDRESAWEFKAFDREVYFSGNTAWFDEKLETWMGECRGSGVLLKTKDGWKIKHYNLSVTVDNDKIQDFIKLAAPVDTVIR